MKLKQVKGEKKDLDQVMLSKEIWKTIPGYEGIYEISDLGNLRSLDRISANGRNLKGKLLKQTTGSSGHKFVALYKEGRGSTRTIHQLVAIAFLGHEPCGHSLVVDHIDNDKLNNNLNNLQLIPNRENCSKDKKGGSSQYVGVSWSKRSSKWKAYITINGKIKYLGCFKDELEASNKYREALDALNQKN